MSGVPILVHAGSVRVLVVGGGPVAARRAAQFANDGAVVRVVAVAVGSGMQQLVDADIVRLETRAYGPSDIGDAQLVIAATDDPAVNHAIASDAAAAHRLVNVADVASTGTFSMMSPHRSGPLTIGVSAGGVPAAARRIRDVIAERFGAPYGDALTQLRDLRAKMLRDGDADRWHAVASATIDAGFCEAVDAGRIDARLTSWR